jgi:hypothetical protein
VDAGPSDVACVTHCSCGLTRPMNAWSDLDKLHFHANEAMATTTINRRTIITMACVPATLVPAVALEPDCDVPGAEGAPVDCPGAAVESMGPAGGPVDGCRVVSNTDELDTADDVVDDADPLPPPLLLLFVDGAGADVCTPAVGAAAGALAHTTKRVAFPVRVENAPADTLWHPAESVVEHCDW